ncbi:hypothetical protein [Nostoc sp. TCL26-01]|uniref:hypothetical protein n=1 Tax=Nostoc sp. TCL26-01 TaxID=2576904 RepID=UPI0015BD3F84|nr:hypothetical protein [Nostoc sp. TCL26-01]QLE58669.1 hypothetical protein FD725_26120 [Nostoc sp. TCL26-01]
MGKRSPDYNTTSQDFKLTATSKIWGTTVAILALCIPLSAVTRSGALLPLAAIGGATAGTFMIWRSDGKKSQAHYLSRAQVELLEQRIANLETIISRDEFEIHQKIQHLESGDTSSNHTQFTTSKKQAQD